MSPYASCLVFPLFFTPRKKRINILWLHSPPPIFFFLVVVSIIIFFLCVSVCVCVCVLLLLLLLLLLPPVLDVRSTLKLKAHWFSVSAGRNSCSLAFLWLFGLWVIVVRKCGRNGSISKKKKMSSSFCLSSINYYFYSSFSIYQGGRKRNTFSP